MPAIELPPVTDAHRRAAFALFGWPGFSFEQAMAVDLRRRLIEARAHGLRMHEHKAQQREQVKAEGRSWCQAAIFGARPTIDLKRLAAHDLDD